MAEDPCPWGGVQPKFDRLGYDGPARFFLIGRLASGEHVRVQLVPGTFRAPGQ